MNFSKPASKEQITKTAESLQKNGMTVTVVKNGEEAKVKVIEILPQGGDVLTMTSVTLDTTGIAKEINESGKYNAIRQKLNSMAREKDSRKMQELGAAPDWTVGSVQAISEDGTVIVASNTGSQLPAYAYGAGHVVWVVGAQKIVKTMEEGMTRLYDYVLPLESERAHKAYGVPASFISKILIFHREINPSRIHVILVEEEPLGF
jgi:L-lactate utilization protein LutB